MLGTKAKAMRTSQIGPLWRIASARMPTRWGMFEAIGFERDISNGSQGVETALAIIMGDPTEGVPLLRIHSQCFTGEMLGSMRCDCHDQLSCEAVPNPHSFAYLRTKKQRMGHALSLWQGESADQTRDFLAVRSQRTESELPDFKSGDHNRAINVAWRARGIEAQL